MANSADTTEIKYADADRGGQIIRAAELRKGCLMGIHRMSMANRMSYRCHTICYSAALHITPVTLRRNKALYIYIYIFICRHIYIHCNRYGRVVMPG